MVGCTFLLVSRYYLAFEGAFCLNKHVCITRLEYKHLIYRGFRSIENNEIVVREISKI